MRINENADDPLEFICVSQRKSAAKTPNLASAQEIDVDVSAQAHVIGEIPADVVTVPEPVVGIAVIVGGYAEVKAVEPETVPATSTQHPDMAAAKSAVKAAVLPRVIEVIVDIGPAAVVSNPSAIVVNVGSIRVAFAVVKMAVLRVLVMFTPIVMVFTPIVMVFTPGLTWAMGWNVFVMAAAVPVAVVIVVPPTVLGNTVNGDHKQNCKHLQSPIQKAFHAPPVHFAREYNTTEAGPA